VLRKTADEPSYMNEMRHIKEQIQSRRD
jgi:hypothetical protein